jgi:hypothetical protein
MRTSVVTGRFTGCLKNQTWSLADGSSFVCQENWRTDLVDAKAVLLRKQADQSYMLLIGGHTYDAALVQLGVLPLATPLTLQAILDAPPVLPSVEPPNDHITSVDSVDSINQLRYQDGVRLNTAQHLRSPLPARNTRER